MISQLFRLDIMCNFECLHCKILVLNEIDCKWNFECLQLLLLLFLLL
jgi:hypothetical protein